MSQPWARSGSGEGGRVHQVRQGIVTPEAVPLEFETASVGSRSVAFGIDLVIIAAAIITLLLAVAALEAGAGVPGWLAVSTTLLIVFGVQFGYPIAFETLWHGRTPGKAALGLRVVTVEGAPVGFRHAAIRAALGVVDFLVSSGAGAVLSILLTRRNQRLGDLAAGTLVLRERTGQRRPTPVEFSPPAGLEGFCARVDTTALDPETYGAVRSFLLRADDLPPHVAGDLARRLAAQVSGRVTASDPPREVGPREYLACIAAAYQGRHSRVAGGGRSDAGSAAVSPRAPAPPGAPGASSGEAAGGATRGGFTRPS